MRFTQNVQEQRACEKACAWHKVCALLSWARTKCQYCKHKLCALLEGVTGNANVACTNYVPRSRAELKIPILQAQVMCPARGREAIGACQPAKKQNALNTFQVLDKRRKHFVCNYQILKEAGGRGQGEE